MVQRKKAKGGTGFENMPEDIVAKIINPILINLKTLRSEHDDSMLHREYGHIAMFLNYVSIQCVKDVCRNWSQLALTIAPKKELCKLILIEILISIVIELIGRSYRVVSSEDYKLYVVLVDQQRNEISLNAKAKRISQYSYEVVFQVNKRVGRQNMLEFSVGRTNFSKLQSEAEDIMVGFDIEHFQIKRSIVQIPVFAFELIGQRTTKQMQIVNIIGMYRFSMAYIYDQYSSGNINYQKYAEWLRISDVLYKYARGDSIGNVSESIEFEPMTAEEKIIIDEYMHLKNKAADLMNDLDDAPNFAQRARVFFSEAKLNIRNRKSKPAQRYQELHSIAETVLDTNIKLSENGAFYYWTSNFHGYDNIYMELQSAFLEEWNGKQ